MAYTTINKGTDHFNTKLYTGTGASHSVTGVGFQPDWVWIKSRSQAVNHYGFDVVRGATNGLSQNISNAESTRDSTWFNSFDSDGFTIGSEANINNSSSTYASWNWLGANGTASNTDGSITSTVSANTTAGFSIVSFTGTGANATVGHGLGVAPKLIIVKRRPGAQSWRVGIDNLGWGNVMYLDSDGGSSAVATAFQSTAPTSSVFSVGTDTGVNGSGDSSIAYCFAPIKGFSKIGKYTGNGSSDGSFIFTGFKPAWVMIKGSSSSRNWAINDTKRDFNSTYGNDASLYANSSGAETTSSSLNIDFLSNGMKLRSNNSSYNGSGFSYYYMAFAEAPIVGTNNVPANAI